MKLTHFFNSSLMRSLDQYIIFLCFSFFISSCSEECRDIEKVYEVYYQAIVFPERFDQYCQENRGKFDNDFFSCLDEKIAKADELIRTLERQCDETFIQGSDFWNQCYDEISGQQNAAAILQTIREVAKDKNLVFSQTQAGVYLIFVKQEIGSADYEYVITQTIPSINEAMKCRFCEDKFFLSDIF